MSLLPFFKPYPFSVEVLSRAYLFVDVSVDFACLLTESVMFKRERAIFSAEYVRARAYLYGHRSVRCGTTSQSPIQYHQLSVHLQVAVAQLQSIIANKEKQKLKERRREQKNPILKSFPRGFGACARNPSHPHIMWLSIQMGCIQCFWQLYTLTRGCYSVSQSCSLHVLCFHFDWTIALHSQSLPF